VSRIYLPKSESLISVSWAKVEVLTVAGFLRKTALVEAIMQIMARAKTLFILLSFETCQNTQCVKKSKE